MRVAAIVVAAGIGKRLKRRLRKPLVRLSGKPMLVWTLKALERAPSIEGIVVVVHPNDVGRVQRLIRSFRFQKVRGVVAGGATRMASVYRGLKRLPDSVRWVMVHDGARPLVTPKLVEEVFKAAHRFGAAIAAVPVVPTIKQAREGWVTTTLHRNHLWAVQTPQAFRRDWLEEAHRAGRAKGLNATDDAALVEALGRRVRILEGETRNLKVTTPEDLIVAEALLKRCG